MAKGKLVVFEGIYGTGRIIVNLVNRLRETLVNQGRAVHEMVSPDTGRALLMGATELDSSWKYGVFNADFFLEMADRARVCSEVRGELAVGKLVLCKHFTVSSIVYAQLKGHDWFREDLNVLEARARGRQFGGEVIPDLTIYVDIPAEAAARELGPKLEGFFTRDDLKRQHDLYEHELARHPTGEVVFIRAGTVEDAIYDEALRAIRALG
jgi:thymidylate kinase